MSPISIRCPGLSYKIYIRVDWMAITHQIIGMLHVPALPGAPRSELDLSLIVDWVLKDAQVLADGAVDALMIENFGDTPFYRERVPAHTIAFMTAIGSEVKRAFKLPLGINVLRNDAEGALAVAAAV